MANMSVVFLGTSSGGGPTESRNCSSLVCDMLADSSLWMVDCAEGTTRQFALQPTFLTPPVRIQSVAKIFITHMHADHIMGIVPLLRNVLYPPRADGSNRTVELYGPAGLRTFVRQNMKMTLTRTADNYIVHELLGPEDPITPCDDAPKDSSTRMDPAFPNVMHYSELQGSDFIATPDGFWRGITWGNGRYHGVDITVDAGPIQHRDPCIGYVFAENQYPSRKLVILGDTYDPSAIVPLCYGASLLVHEATDSHISPGADRSGKLSRRTPEVVQEKALSNGHSVPEMAGAFAHRIDARALVLNHISSRFPAPRNPRDFGRLNVMQDIESHANEAWGCGRRCTAAYDYLRVYVPIEFSSGPSSSSFHPVENPEQHTGAGAINDYEHQLEEGDNRGAEWVGGVEDGSNAIRFEARNFEGGSDSRGGHSRLRYPRRRGRGFYSRSRGGGGRRPY